MTANHISRVTNRDDYCTPPDLFAKLDKVFQFVFDVAATKENALTSYFLESSLEAEWCGIGPLWCNPPFSNKEAFLKKGVESRNYIINGIVFLVPNNARSTSWWRNYALQADLIINLTPRVNYFIDGKEVKGVAFDSCLLVYYPRIEGVDYGLPKEVYWNWK